MRCGFIELQNRRFVLLHHGGLLGLQDVVSEDPGHGHLDGELDPATHGELQEELSEPELGQVAALLQGLWTVGEEGRSYLKMPAGSGAHFYKSYFNETFFFYVRGSFLLTAEVEQVSEEEGMFVEVFYGHHYGSIQAAAESLLRAALICYQGLQHGAHHVQLQRDEEECKNDHLQPSEYKH